ncbi:hypothetical protein LI073_06210 [bacterium 210917-SL.2.15]|nr:hypothetical protein [bacterium 210917-SL.2.15]
MKYITTVQEASPAQVVAALKPQYGSFRALTEKSVLEALLTGVENGLLEETRHALDSRGNLEIYFRAPESGAAMINAYIK